MKYVLIGVVALAVLFLIFNVGPTGKFTYSEFTGKEYIPVSEDFKLNSFDKDTDHDADEVSDFLECPKLFLGNEVDISTIAEYYGLLDPVALSENPDLLSVTKDGPRPVGTSGSIASATIELEGNEYVLFVGETVTVAGKEVNLVDVATDQVTITVGITETLDKSVSETADGVQLELIEVVDGQQAKIRFGECIELPRRGGGTMLTGCSTYRLSIGGNTLSREGKETALVGVSMDTDQVTITVGITETLDKNIQETVNEVQAKLISANLAGSELTEKHATPAFKVNFQSEVTAETASTYGISDWNYDDFAYIVSFDSTNTADPTIGPSESKITRYVWDFGDGTELVETTDKVGLTHIYDDAGTYSVSLTVYTAQVSRSPAGNIWREQWTTSIIERNIIVVSGEDLNLIYEQEILSWIQDHCPDNNGNGKKDIIDPESDYDKDGMPDYWETFYELNPDYAEDSGEDPDKDGIPNLQEYLLNTNPRDPIGSGDDTPIDDTPIDDTPIDDTPIDDTPIDDTPIDDTPVTAPIISLEYLDNQCVMSITLGETRNALAILKITDTGTVTGFVYQTRALEAGVVQILTIDKPSTGDLCEGFLWEDWSGTSLATKVEVAI